MRNWLWLGVTIVCLSPGAVFAQDPTVLQLPGSVSVSIGTLAPSEPGNVVSSVTTEQGVTPFRKGSLFVVGFANTTVGHDTDGMPWNRGTRSTAGVKLVNVTRTGVVQAVFGVTGYDRGDGIRASTAVYASYWTRWRGDAGSTRAIALPNAFPGHLYASSGIVTAAEPNNWITSVSVQQGATLFQYRGVVVTPFAGATAGADTAGYTWNNRVRTDAGLKFSREVLSGMVELGIARRHERSRVTRESHVAPVFFVNLWIGWNPGIQVGR